MASFPPRTRARRWAAAAIALLSLGLSFAEPAKVRLQLKWYHQFQFAGFYAALEKGFYRDAGLDVEIIEGAPGRAPTEEVLSGRADAGVLDSGILIKRLAGQPVVALGSIFQHDPIVLISLPSSGITHPGGLVGKRVMVFADPVSAATINVMLRSEGVDLSLIHFIPHSWNVQDLLDGKTDAMSAYLTDLAGRSGEFNILRPSDYSVDFYGDVLFSSEAFARERPKEAQAFVRASFKGWDYAMSHVEELADYISRLPGVAKRGLGSEQLVTEAKAMKPFIEAEVVEPGHMNPYRWERIAEAYITLGLAKNANGLKGFLFDPAAYDEQVEKSVLDAIFAVAILLAALIAFLAARSLFRTAVLRRTSRLEALKDDLEAKVAERTSELANRNEELKSANSVLEGAMRELREAQGRMLAAEKVAALGRLVGNLAHELNTPLAALVAATSVQLHFLGRSLENFVLAEARLDPEARALLRELRDMISAAPSLPATERAERRRCLEILAEARVPASDAKALTEILLELGLASEASRIAPFLAGEDRDDFVAALRGSLEPYRAARIAEDAVAKATRVVSALRTYSRGGEDEAPTALPLGPCAEGVVERHFAEASKDDAIEIAVPAELGVFFRLGALEQILFNLVDNAVHAAGRKGRITITARESEGKVLLSIEDDGPGIPEELKDRIFEPFFTTRPQGEGAGLGLDSARRLARANSGDLSFESVPGRTVFTVSMPAAKP